MIIEADGFLSNFYPCTIIKDGIYYPSVEHFFQYMKAKNPCDATRIVSYKEAWRAKWHGNRCELRDDWEDVKFSIMEEGLEMKFSQNNKIMTELLATGSSTIVETNNWHDNIWGNCTCPYCENIVGEEMLGKIIMMIRNKELENLK